MLRKFCLFLISTLEVYTLKMRKDLPNLEALRVLLWVSNDFSLRPKDLHIAARPSFALLQNQPPTRHTYGKYVLTSSNRVCSSPCSIVRPLTCPSTHSLHLQTSQGRLMRRKNLNSGHGGGQDAQQSGWMQEGFRSRGERKTRIFGSYVEVC